MPGQVTLRDPDGNAISVDQEAVASALAHGYQPESDDQHVDRVVQDYNDRTYGGLAGKINALAGGVGRGLTLGATDALAGADDARRMRTLQDLHPTASGAGNILGAIAPAILTGGATAGESAASIGEQVLAHSPSGLLGRAGSAVTELGADSGVIGKALAGIGGGAVEGAGQAGGAYLAQSALEDKPLSAEGFVGAMGNGAMFGGAIGGGLALGESAVMKARSLFPRSEVTRAAAESAEKDATSAISDALDNGDVLALKAEQKLAASRARAAVADPETAQKLAALKVSAAEAEHAASTAESSAREAVAKAKAEQIAAQTEAAKQVAALKVKQAESALARQEAMTARATAPRVPRAPRKAFDGGGEPVPTPATEGETVPAGPGEPVPAAEPTDPLMAQLQGTKQALDNGASISEVSGGLEARTPDDVVGAVDPAHAKLADATAELKASRKDLVQAWIKNAKRGAAQNAEERGFTVHYENSLDSAGNRAGARLPAGVGKKLDRVSTPIEESAAAAARREAFGADYAAEPTLAEKIAAGEAVPPKRVISEAETPQGELQAYRRSTPDEIMDISHAQAADRGRELDAAIRDALEKQSAAPRPFTIRVGGKSVETGLSLVDSAAQREFEALGGTDAISTALRHRVGEHGSLAEDVAMFAPKISRFEKASADVADLLGAEAPAGSAQHAAQYRAAVEEQAHQAAATQANAAEDLARGTPELGPKLGREVTAPTAAAGESRAMKLGKNIGDAASAIEALHHLGIPGVPDLREIPVIGPLLNLYMIARAKSAIFRRLGGKVPATTESIIAGKASATRDRVQSAVTKMLDVTAGGVRGARKIAPASAALAVQLFDGKTMPRINDQPPPRDEQQRQYQDRLHELTAAQQPNAIQDSVRKLVPTGDAALQQAITETQTRKLAFLNAKIPKQPTSPTMLRGDGQWTPTKTQLEQFGRYIKAADDPASVLEHLADHGRVTMEEVETLRAVYPTLYAEAQTSLIKAAPTIAKTLPYARRVSLSIMFGIPVDGTMSPDYVAYLRQGAPQAQKPQQAVPPSPSISGGGVATGTRTMTGLDRRAGA